MKKKPNYAELGNKLGEIYFQLVKIDVKSYQKETFVQSLAMLCFRLIFISFLYLSFLKKIVD